MRKSARHPERGSRASKSIHSTSVTVTLFAALEVATGKVATHKKRRRRVEFLAFMNEVTAAYPGKRLDVILDNLALHLQGLEHFPPDLTHIRVGEIVGTFLRRKELDELADAVLSRLVR